MTDLQPIIRRICEQMGKKYTICAFRPDTDYTDTHTLIGWMVEKGWHAYGEHGFNDWMWGFYMGREGFTERVTACDPDFRTAVVKAAAKALGVGDG